MVEANSIRVRRRRAKSLAGEKFGKWTVIVRSDKPRLWSCVCECGTKRDIRSSTLYDGRSKSCGCGRRTRPKVAGRSRENHGMRLYPEYSVWRCIINRCENPRRKGYAEYGAKGISICREWRKSFSAFLAYVGPRPSKRHTIDRYPNKSGNYEPGNVRWATPKEQNRNRRDNVLMTLNGETATMPEWAERTGISRVVLKGRRKLGWPDWMALTTPVRKK